MSWLCLVCECIHALSLSNFARPSFRSFFGWSCWFVAQLNPIAQQTAEWRSSLHVLVCISVQIWGPGLHFGVLIWVIFWSLFRVPFWGTVWAPTITNKIQGPKTAPKNGTQNKDQNMTQIRPQNAIRGPKFVRRCKQGRVEMIFIQRSGCLAILFNCATNQQLQPKKERKLGRAKLLKEREWIHSQTKHSQDMWYLQKIHSQVSRMGKSTACLLLWGYAHASPQNCLFWGPGFGTSFCSILRPLLATLFLGWKSSLQASFHWKMQNVKLPVCPTPAGCISSNSGATVEQFAQRASETGEQSFAMGTFWESWRRCWRPPCPF